MYEYIITAFKVIVGVITNERLTIAAAVALGIMLVWITFSLIFSFQARFASGVRKINNYVSRNGIYGDAKAGLDKLIAKMPTEFQRGYKSFERNSKSLPSENIKRFESLDVELSGGVFNQNKSVLKTYMNFVFVTLLLFSFAILQDASLTGYLIAEAFITPVMFLLFAKVIYYVYTAIRQNQYKTAVEDFNDMLDNLDKSAIDETRDVRANISNVDTGEFEAVKLEEQKTQEEVSYVNTPVGAIYAKTEEMYTEESQGENDEIIEAAAEESPNESLLEEIEREQKSEDSFQIGQEDDNQLEEATHDFAQEQEDSKTEEKLADAYKKFENEPIEEEQTQVADDFDEIAAIREYKAFVEKAQREAEAAGESSQEETFEETDQGISEESVEELNKDVAEEASEEYFVSEPEKQEEFVEESFDELVDEPVLEQESTKATVEQAEADDTVEADDSVEVVDSADDISEAQSEETSADEDQEESSFTEEIEEDVVEVVGKQKGGIVDNFKPDFSKLLEEEEKVEVKRGRGRPRKEVREDGEFVIKNDKEFEEALVRAEKLMRKNEEPLSASQTKRIEKQIKELVDAMTRYKEGK